MKALKLCLGITIVAIVATSCTSVSLPVPKGSSKGYTSARLVKTAGQIQDEGPEGSAEVNNAIQRSIRNQFKTRGMTFGDPNADLIVAYMLIRQGVGMTTMNKDYFGHGRDPDAIFDEAHRRGAIKNKRPDAFKSGTLVIDIIDAKTNKLVYRNYTTRDLLDGVSPVQRDARINVAVAQTLAPFFNPE